MAATDSKDLPNVESILARLVGRVVPARRPLLVAIAERLAAARYRVWAEECADATGTSATGASEMRKGELLACARREEEIATLIEGLTPDAAAIQEDIRRENPDLEEIGRASCRERV